MAWITCTFILNPYRMRHEEKIIYDLEGLFKSLRLSSIHENLADEDIKRNCTTSEQAHERRKIWNLDQ